MPEQVAQSLETVKISDGAYRIEEGGVRALLFVGTKKALLVDTGFGSSGSMKAAVGALTNKPVMLVNTHADRDHIGMNAEFDVAHMHPAEMAHYFPQAHTGARAAALWEGDVIDIGGRAFEVVLIPGHTPGSIALLDRENRIIITGDSVSEGPIFMFGEARNIFAYIASMEKLKALVDVFDTVYPSHGTFPVSPVQVDKQITAANKLLAGELTPSEPPFELPAKMYMHDGAGFLYGEQAK